MGRLTARARDANDILLDTFREAVPGIGDRRFDRRRRVFFRSDKFCGPGQEN